MEQQDGNKTYQWQRVKNKTAAARKQNNTRYFVVLMCFRAFELFLLCLNERRYHLLVKYINISKKARQGKAKQHELCRMQSKI